MMKGIILPTKQPLEIFNKKINDYVIANTKGYTGTQWGEIFKHPIQNKWILIINDDERLPLNGLSNAEKLTVVTIDVDEWFPDD